MVVELRYLSVQRVGCISLPGTVDSQQVQVATGRLTHKLMHLVFSVHRKPLAEIANIHKDYLSWVGSGGSEARQLLFAWLSARLLGSAFRFGLSNLSATQKCTNQAVMSLAEPANHLKISHHIRPPLKNPTFLQRFS